GLCDGTRPNASIPGSMLRSCLPPGHAALPSRSLLLAEFHTEQPLEYLDHGALVFIAIALRQRHLVSGRRGMNHRQWDFLMGTYLGGTHHILVGIFQRVSFAEFVFQDARSKELRRKTPPRPGGDHADHFFRIQS